MEFMELAKKRFSCRKFSDKPVEQEKIEKLLEAAIVAPTAKDLQPFHIWVVRSEDGIAKVNEATKCGFGAKTMFVFGGKEETAWVRPQDGRNFKDVDASIAATHLMLEVETLGLGTTWVGFFDPAKMKEAFPEMQGYDLIAIFPVGYPANDPKAGPIAMHFERKSKEELTTEL